MREYFLILMMMFMVLGQYSKAAAEDDDTPQCCSKRVGAACAHVSDVAKAVDDLIIKDSASSLVLNTTHFLTTLGGTYQILRSYTDDNTAGLIAVAVCAGRMFWVYENPASSIPGTVGVLLLAGIFGS